MAHDQIQAARVALRNHDIYANWLYLPEHLFIAEARVAALDTWHDWATGKPVNHQRLVHAATTLHEAASPHRDDGSGQLAAVIYRWAQQQGVQLTPPPVEQHRSLRTGIEIDL